MSTKLEAGGEASEQLVRRKRRPRKRAEAIARAAVTVPIGIDDLKAETAPLAVAVEEPQPLEPPQPPQPPEPEDFHDLLGQAVGLRLDKVGRVFEAGDQAVTALRGVSLEIAPGEFVSVMGPSGCGKTTLLSMMGGPERPTRGQG